jgi:benzoate-CoA ligase
VTVEPPVSPPRSEPPPATAIWPRDNLATAVLAGRDPGRVALREPDRSWSYGELGDQAARVAAVLRGAGVAAGDRVAVLMPDSLEAAAAILGVIYMGGVAVPLSELATPVDIRDCVADSGAVAAIVHARLAPTVAELRRELPALRELLCVGGPRAGATDLGARMRSAAPDPRPVDVAPTDPAILLYSAGALDGAARGVAHAHATPVAALAMYGRAVLGLAAEDRVFSVVRLSTAYGLGTGLLLPLLAGAETMLLPAQPHSAAIFSVVESFRPTVLLATPSVYGQLARDADGAALDRPLRGVRAAVSGAEGMPAQLVTRVQATLGVEVLLGYGLTEAFQFVLATRAGAVKPGSSGQLVPGFEARLVGDDGRPVGTDEIGTLEIRGPTVSRGYFSGRRADDQHLADGWFRTRDRFMADAAGHHVHCGRVDDLFKVGGKWVSPTEVEQTLLAHEAVWECAVIGAEDQDGLVKPLAFVVANIGHRPTDELARELRAHVKRELAPYKYPRWIEFVRELPKGPAGKLLRYKLRPPPMARRRAETASP